MKLKIKKYLSYVTTMSDLYKNIMPEPDKPKKTKLRERLIFGRGKPFPHNKNDIIKREDFYGNRA